MDQFGGLLFFNHQNEFELDLDFNWNAEM